MTWATIQKRIDTARQVMQADDDRSGAIGELRAAERGIKRLVKALERGQDEEDETELLPLEYAPVAPPVPVGTVDLRTGVVVTDSDGNVATLRRVADGEE